MDNRIEMLLNEVKLIGDKYDLINKKTGGYFNIFEITNINTDEVAICRFLKEILSPKGSHHQGILYLRSFIKDVLNLNITDDELLNAHVFREYHTSKNRRIDLVIKTENYFIPIEVKIYAGEQQNQCFDYYKYAKKSNIYYLTRFGECPSSYSLGSLSEEKVTAISFETDILDWLDTCLGEKETIVIAPIREVFLQFSDIIRKFTNNIQNKNEVEITNIISRSPSTMRNSVEIQKSIQLCKIELVKKIFESIEKKVKIEKIKNRYDYEYKDAKGGNVEKYFSRTDTFPGLSYLYKNNVEKNIDIWLRIEIDHRIFIGFCTPKRGKWAGKVLSSKIISNLSEDVEFKYRNWWIKEENILEYTENDTPNFKEMNEAAIALFDKDKFEKFTDVCADKINEFLSIKLLKEFNVNE